MKIIGRGLRLTICIGAHDIWHRKPLCHQIARQAPEAGSPALAASPGVEAER